MQKNGITDRIVTLISLLIFFISCSNSQTPVSYESEDSNNIGSEFEYNQPTIPDIFWSAYSRTTSSYNDIKNGDVLKNIPVRAEWGSPNGLFSIWFGNDEYIFNLPIVVGGQVKLQWADIETTKGNYSFTTLDKLLKAYYDRKLYASIQIDGNKHPDWMFNEIPYLSNIQLNSQVADSKGTLMYWYPLYITSYQKLIEAIGNYLKTSPYLKSVIGIRFNPNAIGTEFKTPPKNYDNNGIPLDTRNCDSYYYPPLADKTFKTYWTSAILSTYQINIYQKYADFIGPYVRVYLRNDIEADVITSAQTNLTSGKTGLFHTSSEPEPRASVGEDKLTLFNKYSRTPLTINYAEPWTDPWGAHADGTEDPHFCSPQQWNYWRILCDLNVGISQIAMHGDYWTYCMGGPAPANKQFPEINFAVRRDEMQKGINFAYKYVGQHNNPATSPGAFVAFRKSTENLSIKNNPTFYGGTSFAIQKFTGDYTFLITHLPDNSVGLKLIGDNEQRYGAFARQIPAGGSIKMALHPLFAKAIYNKDIKLRVIYYDGGTENWSVLYGKNTFTVQNTGTKSWKVAEWNVKGAPRLNPMSVTAIIEKGSLATATELNTLVPEITLKANNGTPVFHLVEIDRSTLFNDMYQKDKAVTNYSGIKMNGNLKASVSSGNLHVMNVDPLFPLELYDISGRKLAIISSVCNTANFKLVEKGLYIVRNNNNVLKLVF
jgi:hypothetical protein